MNKLATMGLLFLSLCGGASAREYRGADAGTLVLSIGIMHGNKGDYTLMYKAADGSSDSHFSYIPTSILEDADDYQNDGDETGQVQIHHLKPGTYVFYSFKAVDALVELSPHAEFSLPFTIRPGQTIYIGDFAGVMPFLGPKPLGAYFALSDKHERDLAIARKKEPGLMPVTSAVPDAAALGIAGIEAKEIALPGFMRYQP